VHSHNVTSRPAAKRRRRALLGAIAALSAVVLVAACGSSGGSGSSSGAGASSSSGAGASSSSQAGLAAAEALVSKYSQQPTTIPAHGVIGKPIPKGKTVVFVSCGTPNCSVEGNILQQATSLLGWTLKVINTKGTPESEKAAFDEAAQEKVNVVLYSAVDRSTFASDIPAFVASGTFLGACCITDKVGNGIDYAIDTPSQTALVGQLMAAWIIADSKGSAKTVYFDLPAFSILGTQGAAFNDYLTQNCPSCSADTVDIPVTDLGYDVPAVIVAYLRAHPSVNYVALSVDALAVGLPAALKAARLSGVKIVGEGATTINLQYIHAGQQGASVGFPYYEVLWAMVDAAARHEAGVPVNPSVGATPWLLVKDNAPVTDTIFPTVKNYEAQFKQLWGLG
jgi:ABC-type sugar transport system substrate-binding protein